MKLKIFTFGDLKVIAENRTDAKYIQGKMKPLIESTSRRPKKFYWFCFFYIEGIHAEPIEKKFYNRATSMIGEKETINKLVLALDTYFLVLKEPVKAIIDLGGKLHPAFVAEKNKKPSHWSVIASGSTKYIIKMDMLPIKDTTLKAAAYSGFDGAVNYEIR